MLKYTNYKVVFAEVPDEISLAIEISNCPHHCPECHSKELWEDIGEELTFEKIVELVEQNEGVTCVCFMGGDSDLNYLFNLFSMCSTILPSIKIAWYSGLDTIPKSMPLIDYVKIGKYKSEYGPLNNPNTNQRFYTLGKNMKKLDASQNMYYDTTNKFWKNDN